MNNFIDNIKGFIAYFTAPVKGFLNFTNSMVSGGSEVSSKRVVAVAMSVIVIYGYWYILHHVEYKDFIMPQFKTMCVFIGITFGLFTLPDIIKLLRPGSAPDPVQPDTK